MKTYNGREVGWRDALVEHVVKAHIFEERMPLYLLSVCLT